MDAVMKLTDSYWEILKSLSNEVKLRLATRLMESILGTTSEQVDRTEEMLEKHCGAWVGDESAESIVANIYASRQGCKNPLNLD